jgi:hypothetical protein
MAILRRPSHIPIAAGRTIPSSDHRMALGREIVSENPYRFVMAEIIKAYPGFLISTRHHLAYRFGDGVVLVGVLLDLSGLEKGAFYLTAFAQPRYVPCDHLFLTYGDRLAKGKRWKINPDNQDAIVEQMLDAIQRDGLPLLGRFDTVQKLAAVAQAPRNTRESPFGWSERDPNVIEARAYSWTLLGKEENTRRDLYYLTQHYVPQYDWEKELQSRSGIILGALDIGLEKAQGLLREWARETIHKLGLSAESWAYQSLIHWTTECRHKRRDGERCGAPALTGHTRCAMQTEPGREAAEVAAASNLRVGPIRESLRRLTVAGSTRTAGGIAS